MVRGKTILHFSEILKTRLQLKFMEQPICLGIQYSVKLASKHKISVAIQPKKAKR